MLGLNEYARHRGVTLRAVQKAIEAGRISHVLNTRGQRQLISKEQADQEWQANTVHDKKRIATRGQRARGVITPSQVMDEAGDEPKSLFKHRKVRAYKSEPAKTESPKQVPLRQAQPESSPVNEGLQFSKVRAMREGVDFKLKDLEYKKRLGLLVPIDQVKQVLFTMSKGISENMLNITPRLASNLAACDNEFEVTQMLDTEIRRALEGLANGSFEFGE